MHSMRYYSGAIRYSRRLQYRVARAVLGVGVMGVWGLLVAGVLLKLT